MFFSCNGLFMALKSLCLIFIICVQVVPQIPPLDDAMHPPHHNIPISAKDGWLVLVSPFFSCNGSHSWHLTDGHSPIIMHSHYIMCTGCTANYILFTVQAAMYAAGRHHPPLWLVDCSACVGWQEEIELFLHFTVNSENYMHLACSR